MADKKELRAYHQDGVPMRQDDVPLTPVSAGGLISLQNLITHDLNQKVCSALSNTYRNLPMQPRWRSTTKITSVLNVPFSISFEDIVVARAARAAKDVIKEKGKRGRKRKSAALEPDEQESEPECESESECDPALEPEPEMVRAAKEVMSGKGKRGQKRKIAVQEAVDEPEPEPEPGVARLIDPLVPWGALRG